MVVAVWTVAAEQLVADDLQTALYRQVTVEYTLFLVEVNITVPIGVPNQTYH